MNHVEEMNKIVNGASCVISALAGLREAIIAAQKKLLDAAVTYY